MAKWSRRMYKVQAKSIADMLYNERKGHFTIAGPRAGDGYMLVIVRNSHSRHGWFVTPSGLMEEWPTDGSSDPAEFGIVKGDREGEDYNTLAGRSSDGGRGYIPRPVPGQLAIGEQVENDSGGTR